MLTRNELALQILLATRRGGNWSSAKSAFEDADDFLARMTPEQREPKANIQNAEYDSNGNLTKVKGDCAHDQKSVTAMIDGVLHWRCNQCGFSSATPEPPKPCPNEGKRLCSHRPEDHEPPKPERETKECEHIWKPFGILDGYESWRCDKCSKVESTSRPKVHSNPKVCEHKNRNPRTETTQGNVKTTRWESCRDCGKTFPDPPKLVCEHGWSPWGSGQVRCWKCGEEKPEPPKPERVAREWWVLDTRDKLQVFRKFPEDRYDNFTSYGFVLVREILPGDEHDKR